MAFPPVFFCHLHAGVGHGWATSPPPLPWVVPWPPASRYQPPLIPCLGAKHPTRSEAVWPRFAVAAALLHHRVPFLEPLRRFWGLSRLPLPVGVSPRHLVTRRRSPPTLFSCRLQDLERDEDSLSEKVSVPGSPGAAFPPALGSRLGAAIPRRHRRSGIGCRRQARNAPACSGWESAGSRSRLLDARRGCDSGAQQGTAIHRCC